MKITVIAADEKRDRQKFISKPLIDGGHVVCVVKTRPSSSFLYRVLRLLIKDAPDVIIFMGTGPKELLALGIVKLMGVPFVVRLGGDTLRDLCSVAESRWREQNYLQSTIYKLHAYTSRFFLKRTGMMIVVNAALSEKVEQQLKIPHKIFVIPQYCEGMIVDKNYTINNPVQLLTVSNFLFSEKAEGVVWIINALTHFVLKHEILINLRVAGGGQHLKDVEKYLCSYERTELLKVEVLGFVDNLDYYYSSTDVFVYRSFHDATPNVILESKRHGLPLLANNCTEFQSIVDDGKSGYLYQSEDEFNLRIFQLIENQGLRHDLGSRASQECAELYSIANVRKELEAALSDSC